ncbi:glycosyltransferase [Microbacterium sp. zg.Y909]|uniref:glycosyltransferase n=1 Tax=Microbacterium sp. zg.Y909 TaxID=2969413 RepID=UPI00214B761D|nr:glycosyltransferase [Microbacterium sp. zg.Y909]MCR2823960.1 glycosyltransferase [Microbacterium sp. zg.Y909]
MLGRERDPHQRGSVLFVGINYAPEPTGISPYTTGMAEGLAARGWKVGALTSYPHYPWWTVPAEHDSLPAVSDVRGVRLRRLRHYIPRHPDSLRRALFEVAFGVRAVCSHWGRPDAIVAVSPALLASRLVALRARMQRIPVITWVQDIYALGVTETGGGTGARAIAAIERDLAQSSQRVVVIHHRFRRMMRDDLGVTQPIDVVRNWSHVPDMDGRHRAETRRRLGWADDEMIVLHAGAMGAKQGLENVIEAARIGAASGSAVRFVLLGDGSQRAALQAAPGSDAVTFIDPLPDDEFYAALSAADALLVNERPGLTEMSVPSKLTTYFATGLPVIAAVDLSSTTYGEIDAADAGPIVPAGDPVALVAAAEAICADPVRAARHGKAARAYRDRLLTAEAAISEFENVLARTLDAARPERARQEIVPGEALAAATDTHSAI